MKTRQEVEAAVLAKVAEVYAKPAPGRGIPRGQPREGWELLVRAAVMVAWEAGHAAGFASAMEPESCTADELRRLHNANAAADLAAQYIPTKQGQGGVR